MYMSAHYEALLGLSQLLDTLAYPIYIYIYMNIISTWFHTTIQPNNKLWE
jgi:hypothetical protein